MQREPTSLEVTYNSLGERGTLSDWINKNKREGSWGGFSVSVFLSYMLRINALIVSHFNKGFLHQSTYEILQYEHNTITPTMHLCHHLHNRPTVASNECNHFALLKAENNLENYMSRQVYEGDTNSEYLGEEQLVTHQAGGSKSHQILRNNKKLLGTKVKRFVEVSRCSKYNHVLEWMHELLSDAWNNSKSLFITFILLLLNSMLTFIRCAS